MLVLSVSSVVFSQEIEKITIKQLHEKNIYPTKYNNVKRTQKKILTQKDIQYYLNGSMLLYSENKEPIKNVGFFNITNASLEVGAKVGGGYLWDSTILGASFENYKSASSDEHQLKRKDAIVFLSDFQYNNEFSSYLKYFIDIRQTERERESYSLTESLIGAGFEANYTYNLFLKLYMGISFGGQVNLFYNYEASSNSVSIKSEKDSGVYQGYDYWVKVPLTIRISDKIGLSFINSFKKYEPRATPELGAYPMLFVPTNEYNGVITLSYIID